MSENKIPAGRVIPNYFSFLITAFILLNLFVIGANAESGTLIIDDSTTKTYTQAGALVAAMNWSAIYFDVANYNSISYIQIEANGYSFVFGYPFESTSFTCTGVNYCSGYAWYDANSTRVYYNFNTGSQISASPIVLSFANNVLNNVTATQTANAGGCTFGIAAATPARLCSTHTGALSYNQVTVGTYAVDSYDVTYPSSGFFSVNVTKNSFVSTKYYINGSSSSYSVEPTFNKVNIVGAFFPYTDGIILNATLSSGIYSQVIVNSTNCPLCISPTPSPTPAPIPSGSDASITFSSDSYGIGDAGTVITNTSFGILDLYSYRIDFFSQTMPLIQQFPIDKSQTSQSFVVQFPVEDLYTAQIVRSFPLTSDTIIASDTAQAIQGTASIIVPLKAAVGKNFSVYYTFDYQPATNNMCGLGGTGLFLIYQKDGSIKQARYLQTISELTQGTNYSINMSAPIPGTYIIQVRDCSQGVVGTSIPFTIEFMSSIPEYNISLSYINLDSTMIYDGDVITGQFGIDNTNWTQNGVYYAIYNYTNGEIFRNSLPGGQMGSFSQITEGYDLENNIFINNLIPAGTNKISLRAFNGSNDFEIAYANFTFSRVTAAGYDLSVDKMCVSPTNTVKLYVVVPSGVDSHILIASSSGNYTKTINLNTSQTILYAPTKLSHYIVTVFDSGSNSQKSVDFTSSNFCNNGFPGEEPTIPSGGSFPGINGSWTATQTSITSTCSYWDGWVNLIFGTQGVNDVTRFEFSALIIMSILGFTTIITRSIFNGIAVGFFPYAFFLFLSLSTPCGTYMPLWTGVFIALIIAAKLKWF